MRENKEAQTKLDNLLLACFSVQKMYGRQPENIEIINQVFHDILGKYRSGLVLLAFETWMERSQEFPTPADISNLIKRNGRPPLEKAIYVAIGKKYPEDRTSSDWAYIREYEEQANDEAFGSDFTDPVKQEVSAHEFQGLKSRVRELETENGRLADLLHEARKAKGIEPPKPTEAEKINKTIEYMKSLNSPEQDIRDFIASQGLPASYGVTECL